ncbi:MAG: IS21 family transposase [Maricaulaceae bacterium]
MKTMTQYRALLKLLFLTNLSPSAIARSRGMSHNTLIDLRKRAITAGLTIEKLNELHDSELQELLFPLSQESGLVYPTWETEIAFMEKGYNRTEAHSRYADRVGLENALTYSTYCKKLKKYLGTLRKVYRHIHKPGHSMQIDFAGYTPIGLKAGVKTKFQLFVAILPSSSLTFATAVLSQSTIHHNDANILALEYFGGVPEVVCSDNLKAAVVGWHGKNIPIINARFLNLADHYGFRPKPARVYTPQDKAAVENAVKYVQRLLRQVLINQPLMELRDINTVLREIIEKINNKNMRRRGKSRRELFDAIESSYLLPLPPERLVSMDTPKTTVVNAEYHVPYDKSYYSVPHRLTGLKVSIRGNANSVEIRHDGQVVAKHVRSCSEYTYVTIDAHRHPNHALYNKIEFEGWLGSLPESVRELTILKIGKSEEQRKRERLIAKVRKLFRDYGRDRVSYACRQAIQNSVLCFKHVENLLKNNLEEKAVANDRNIKSTVQPTQNIRGSSYFFARSNTEGDT